MAALPQPSSSPYAGMTVREIVRDLLQHSRPVNPHHIESQVYAILDSDQFEEVVRYGIAELVNDEVRKDRARAFKRPKVKKAAKASPKWAAIAKAVKAHPDVFGTYIQVGNGASDRVFLGDCNRDDLFRAAKLQDERGRGAFAQRNRYLTLRKKLTGTALVKSLPKATVEQVMWA